MKKILTFLVIASLIFCLPECKGKIKDADIKTSVDAVITDNADYRGTTAVVNGAVVTLTGEVKDASVQSALQKDVAAVKGVKSVQNNTTVAPVVEAPVITPDDSLTTALKDALKDHPGVAGTVNDGVVTLTGAIKKADLPKLIQKINALKPKKIDNQLTVN